MRSLAVIFAIFGLAVSSTLLFRSYELLSDNPSANSVCTIIDADCDDALQSEWATVSGLPLAGWGVIYFSVVLILLAIANWLNQAFDSVAIPLLTILATGAAVISVALSAAILTGNQPNCPLCLAVHAMSVALAVVQLVIQRRSRDRFLVSLTATGRWLVGKDSDSPETDKWRFLALLTPALAAVVVYQWIVIEFQPPPEGTFSAQAFAALADFESSQKFDLTIAGDRPTLGDPAAPLQLIVFSDFRCKGCREFGEEITKATIELGDKLVVEFRHFPLESGCNPALDTSPHPGACELAHAAEAAHSLGEFWQFHQRLFKTPLAEQIEVVDVVVGELGVSQAEFRREKDSGATRDAVQADIITGLEIGVTTTPAAFLNRRRIPDSLLDQIVLLLRHELEHVGG